jgi:hypothetical protein
LRHGRIFVAGKVHEVGGGDVCCGSGDYAGLVNFFLCIDQPYL